MGAYTPEPFKADPNAPIDCFYVYPTASADTTPNSDMIVGPEERGTVSRPKKLGVLRQDQFAFDEFRVIDTVVMGNARLWSALQEREIRRVGAERTIKVNARVVAATNRELRAAVDAGTFREDLYFRVGAFVITVPPLRDRREDIPPLAHSFLVRAASRM